MGAISVLIGVLIIVVGRDLFLGHRPFCPGGCPTQTAAQASCRASLPWRHSAEVACTNVLDGRSDPATLDL
jgi:hypothetical protein